LQYLGHVYRALTAPKNGPTVYDLCDPLLLGPGSGDAHLRKFYKTAIANPALRPLLSRAGLSQLRDPAQFNTLRDAIVAARDQASPDWLAVGRPVAALLDQFPHSHPKRPPAPPTTEPVPAAELDRIITACARHLLRSYARHDFIPCYAAFNLIGDPDFRGRDLLIALQGLNARAYKNSTLLFNLTRAFIAGAPAAAVINPPWRGLAELIWSPVQIRHRSAYYDAFYAEALMDFLGSGLATAQEAGATRRTVEQLIGFCLNESRERVPSLIDRTPFDVVTALAPAPHARFSRFFAKKFLGAGIFGEASWDQAIANLQKAVELDPGRIYHRLELARIYADRKRYQEALDQLGRISSLPDREILDPLYRERAMELQRRIGDRT